MQLLRCQPMLVMVLIVLMVSPIYAEQQAQEETVRQFLTTIMNQARKGNNPYITEEEDIFAADPRIVLDALKPFYTEPSPNVREEAIGLAWRIARRSSSRDIRQEVVERLMHAFATDAEVSYTAYGYLLSSKAEDFTGQAKGILRQFFDYNVLEEYTLLVAGVADLRDQIPKIRDIRMKAPVSDALLSSLSYGWWKQPEWYARLALARMGSREDTLYCIEIVESWPDEETRVLVLLKYLAYIRQPEAIRVLEKYLNSDKVAPIYSNDTVGREYCDVALDLLANILEDFPVAWDRVYTDEDVEIARAWMRGRTTFKIKR